jgi:hypothetical protein
MKNPPAHTNGPPKNPGKPRLEQVARRLKTARPSFGQERLWLVQQLAPDSAAYSETSAIRVRGPLDVSLLERSVNEVVKRHEALRTAFAVVKGRPVQVILQSLAVSLRVHDLQGMPASERDAEAIRRLTADASQPFDLSQAPLFRSAVICLGHADHILAYTVHHIIGDARAVAILNEDVVIAYKDLALGQPISLAPLSTTYAEFARQQRAALEGRRMDELLGYWETRLTGSAPLNLPCDRPRPATPTFRGDVFTLRLPPELHHRLKLSGRSEGATPFITVLAALNVLLYRWTGQSDVSVGAAVSLRDRP